MGIENKTIITCDKCKKEIGTRHWPNAEMELTSRTRIYFVKWSQAWDHKETIILCQNCFEHFKEWLFKEGDML